ncbi:MAG: 3-hydroxyacyl-ACP dehydratase FabZ [Candidatus Gastranaerophilales bacterium]|nr:3-hydroxyacyl-ACP dehydratase FabZ [Candidatus Gastranaerophilales bacterium]
MTETQTKPISLDIIQIMDMIPHRYPFLLVDRITECVPMQYSKGYKNLSANEMFFNGHFPNNPIMPGVLQIEALAQAAAPIILSMEQYKGKLALFAGVDSVRFKNIVRPGDKFEMEVTLTKVKGPIAKCSGKGFVDGKLCIEAEITIALK